MEIFKILGTVALNGTDKFNKDIDSVSDKGSGLASKLSKGLGTAAKVTGAALAAAATATGAIISSSIAHYAEYEQLVGGVETLFGDSADKVKQYADNAFKTAGLSANEYMSTVTSFSASLLQSLGGDTAAAAEYADRAVTDMSDNANKMGTDMASIQNAYQGFAKQNYTMLDNLKLGYGGTKSEMERLISDANDLREAQGLNADLTIDSYADIVDAIHTVQTEMGITGTTAKEASTTIQGSISSMKSAWANFLTGLANEDADLGQLSANLVSSIETVEKNVLSRIQIIIPRLIAVAPSLISAGAELIAALVGGIVQNLPQLVPAFVQGIGLILQTIWENLPAILDAGGQLIAQLLVGIWNGLSNSSLGQWIDEKLIQPFKDKFPNLAQVGGEFMSWIWTGLTGFVEEHFPGLAGMFSRWFGGAADEAVTEAGSSFQALPQEAESAATAAMQAAAGAVMSAPELVPADAPTPVSVMAENMKSDTRMEEAGSEAVSNAASTMTTAVNTAGFDGAGRSAMQKFIDGMNSMSGAVMAAANAIASQAVNAIMNAIAQAQAYAYSAAGSVGRYKTGLDYVPYDDFPALLHKGEAVLTASEAAAWRAGKSAAESPVVVQDSGSGSSSGINIVQNIQSVPQTPAEFGAATVAYFEQARWAMA